MQLESLFVLSSKRIGIRTCVAFVFIHDSFHIIGCEKGRNYPYKLSYRLILAPARVLHLRSLTPSMFCQLCTVQSVRVNAGSMIKVHSQSSHSRVEFILLISVVRRVVRVCVHLMLGTMGSLGWQMSKNSLCWCLMRHSLAYVVAQHTPVRASTAVELASRVQRIFYFNLKTDRKVNP